MLAVAGLSPAFAQESISCGTEIAPEYVPIIEELHRRGFDDPGEISDRFVPNIAVTLHVVRRTNGSGGFSSAEADAALARANEHWAQLGIQFFRRGNVDFINDDGLFDTDLVTELAFLWARNNVANTVNIYFVNTLTDLGTPPDRIICGIAALPVVPGFTGAAVSINSICNDGTNSVLAHELGHYFDLFHTHETTLGEECPNGSNCATAGDLICDTPASPDLLGEPVSGPPLCQYTGSLTRCGQPFQPATTNIMSYVRSECPTDFTAGQRRRVFAALLNSRSNLVNAGNPGVIWVDWSAGAIFPDGSFANAYNTLADALTHVTGGGRIVMKGGSRRETMVIGTSALLDAFNGSAVIGQ